MENIDQIKDEKVIFLHGLSQYKDGSMTLDLVEIDLDADMELHDENLPRMKINFDTKDYVIDFIDTGINKFMQLNPLHFSELSIINYPDNHAFVINTNFMSLIFMYGNDDARTFIKDFMLNNKIKFQEERNLIQE